MTTEPTPPAPPVPEPPPPTFYWGSFIGALVLTLVVGGIGNVIADLAGTSSGSKLLGFLYGAIPGALFILLYFVASKKGFAQGLLIGGCIIALIGGACGASMVGMSFH